MTHREKLFAKFYQVATGILRLDSESAEAFATHVANANEAIHVVSSLCTGANALKSETLAVMLERWFRVLPEYDIPRRLLNSRPGLAAPVVQVESANALMLHSRVFEVCVTQRKLPESQSLQVANHIREAVSAFFALEQRCRAPERHTQKVLCATLRTALGHPLSHAREGALVFLGAGDA